MSLTLLSRYFQPDLPPLTLYTGLAGGGLYVLVGLLARGAQWCRWIAMGVLVPIAFVLARQAILASILLVLTSATSAEVIGAGLRHEKNPYQQLAAELQYRRVVALADFAHQNAYPFFTVTQVLSNWLEQGSSKGGQLVLALEADAQMGEVLRQYLQTGDLEPVLEFWLPFSSLDQLEFYGHLRDFTLRVREVNQELPSNRQVVFQVLGLEPPSPLSASNVTAADLPSVWQAGKVANERDRRIAQNLTAYLQAHPQDHALVFYGDGHLPIRAQSSSWAKKLFGATDTWRTMGTLLKEQLGSNFLSVAQLSYPPETYRSGSPYRALTTHDILVKAADIPWKHPHRDLNDFDAAVFFNLPGMDEPHLLKYLCSRRVLDRAIARQAWLEQLPKNAFTAKHSVFSTTLAGLRLITGQSFEQAAQWKAWAATNAYNGFVRMESDDFAEAIRKACGQIASRERNAMLSSLGLPPILAFRQREITPQQWQEAWPTLQTNIHFLQCVGLYWVGYPEEKDKARQYLVKISGQEFDSPAGYLQWYRQKRLHLTY